MPNVWVKKQTKNLLVNPLFGTDGEEMCVFLISVFVKD